MKTSLVPHIDEPRIPERKLRLWSAFAHRDFRLLWIGLLISNVGFWMQFTSLTYLVGVVLAHNAAQSALNLGLVGAARSLPVFAFSPIAGFIADHFPRRRTLLITNTGQALLALALAFTSQHRGPWVLYIVYLIAALQAMAQTFDSPARQSWIPILVPRNLISNAIGLNSIAFNGPMTVGPAIAGILIGTVGVHISFFVNAGLTCAVVLALVFMAPAPPSSTSREPVFQQVAEGLRFIASHPVLRWIIGMLVVTSFTVRPFTSLLAAFATHVVHVDASGYGWLLAAGGIGTVVGAVTTALYQSERRGGWWFFAGTVSALGVIALGYTHDFGIALFEQAVLGFGMMSFIGSSNVLVQTLSPDDMRGRAVSVYSMTILGLVPAGTLVLGFLGSQIGLSLAFVCGGAVALVAGVWVWLAHPALRRA
ncbi:MAG: MFS transporter [Vulcanimicrobiaceae bacterium]|jgi:MFS family permease